MSFIDWKAHDNEVTPGYYIIIPVETFNMRIKRMKAKGDIFLDIHIQLLILSLNQLAFLGDMLFFSVFSWIVLLRGNVIHHSAVRRTIHG